MKEIILNIWWSSGMDGDGYESIYEVSDKNYSKIIALIRKYAKQNIVGNNAYIDPEEFDAYFSTTAPTLYNQISKKVKKELTATSIETAKDWFDEKTEGCSIEEYMDNVYTFGFYIPEKWIMSHI